MACSICTLCIRGKVRIGSNFELQYTINVSKLQSHCCYVATDANNLIVPLNEPRRIDLVPGKLSETASVSRTQYHYQSCSLHTLRKSYYTKLSLSNLQNANMPRIRNRYIVFLTVERSLLS